MAEIFSERDSVLSVIILKELFSELLVNIDPKLYRKYVVIEKYVKVLYKRLQKYLYGMLRISLLFYLKIMKDLKNNGFRVNTYDPFWKINWSMRKW